MLSIKKQIKIKIDNKSKKRLNSKFNIIKRKIKMNMMVNILKRF